MPDLNYGLVDARRQAYLVRNVLEDNRLYWVMVAKSSNQKSRVAVLRVVDTSVAADRVMAATGPPHMDFRIKSSDEKGRLRTRGRPRPLCWDKIVLESSMRAMELGFSNEVCITALHVPPSSTTLVRNNHRYNVTIMWYNHDCVEPVAAATNGNDADSA